MSDTVDKAQAWDAIAAKNAEIAMLRKGIQDYLDGNYENARKHRLENPHYRCKHGAFYWEDCGGCIDAHFTDLIEREVPSSAR